jgi:hypothetical protein
VNAYVSWMLTGAAFGTFVAWQRWREGIGFHWWTIVIGIAAGFAIVRLTGIARVPPKDRER